jgi:hypothetical protein
VREVAGKKKTVRCSVETEKILSGEGARLDWVGAARDASSHRKVDSQIFLSQTDLA